MITRRPLGETLSAFADLGELLAAGSAQGLQVRGMAMELPLDLRLARGPDGPVLIADLPQSLTRTAFDPEPVRLAVTLQAVPLPADTPHNAPTDAPTPVGQEAA